jgi:glycosyltransferase involved in cell wall biosynthesis
MPLVLYISPSILPSRSANSIHVVNMCEALSQLRYRVILLSAAKKYPFNYKKVFGKYYGVCSKNIRVVSYYSMLYKGVEIGIALRSLITFFIVCIKGDKPAAIISRNIYAALLLGVLFRQRIIYESHCPEYGFRKQLQRWLISSSKICTVVISEALKKVICQYHSINDDYIYVFHDAARAGALQLNSLQRKEEQLKLLAQKIEIKKFTKCVGYFGHLYSGRGIEVIQGVAKLNSSHAFFVYGGNEIEIKKYVKNNTIDNIFFMGHLSPDTVHSAMRMMDVLLMPYQKSVSIGLDGVDTSNWMSPIKMFEYMSVGVPIISSNLPVLREVLVNGKNSLLVREDDVDEWSNALQKIINDDNFATKLGTEAYNQYKNRYTWKHRAEGMIALWGSDGN